MRSLIADHEATIAALAKKIGFTHISVSSLVRLSYITYGMPLTRRDPQLSPQIKMVPRATSSSADAYLTPVLKEYLSSFFLGFDDKLSGSGGDGARVEFMTSEGSLVEVDKFSGLKSILSGPAGGVVAYSLTSWDDKVKMPVIGFDMVSLAIIVAVTFFSNLMLTSCLSSPQGGTSTDVSRFAGRYETVYETTTAGISIQSPQLDINTVAAGGGSCLTFRNGLFNVGPESAGAHPGPGLLRISFLDIFQRLIRFTPQACYRKGGPLATTDANLVLGRLLPEYFPKVGFEIVSSSSRFETNTLSQIFGKSEKEPLDVEASRLAFEALRTQINDFLVAEGGKDAKQMSLDEVAYGFVKIANETMAYASCLNELCRP